MDHIMDCSNDRSILSIGTQEQLTVKKMRKRITDMTPEDKAAFFEATKKEMLRLHGIP